MSRVHALLALAVVGLAAAPASASAADPTNVPAGVQSFTLILHDPDVALQRNTDDVLHWMIFNIPGTARELAEGVPANATLADGTVNAKNLRGARFVVVGVPQHEINVGLFDLAHRGTHLDPDRFSVGFGNRRPASRNGRICGKMFN